MEKRYITLGTAQNRASPAALLKFKNCYRILYRAKSDIMVEEEKIAQAVAAELEKRRSINVESHRKHHEFIDTLISEAETRQARREQWIRAVGGWGIIATITAFAGAIWQFFKSQING